MSKKGTLARSNMLPRASIVGNNLNKSTDKVKKDVGKSKYLFDFFVFLCSCMYWILDFGFVGQVESSRESSPEKEKGIKVKAGICHVNSYLQSHSHFPSPFFLPIFRSQS